MHDDDSRCTEPRRHFALVSIAAIVSHRPPAEHLVVELGGIARIRHRRVVDQHDQCLAAHLQTLVIIPTVFGSDHPIADEDQLRAFDAYLGRALIRPGYELARALELDGPFTYPEGGTRFGLVCNHRHRLRVAAVLVAGLEPDLLELTYQILDGQGFAVGGRRPAFEIIRGQDLVAQASSFTPSSGTRTRRGCATPRRERRSSCRRSS